MLVILSQKIDTESSYSDELFRSYHYPAKYRNQLHEGDIFIYYQGNRHDKSHRYYFGVGTVGEIMTTDGENYYARLVNCRQFENQVPIYLPDGGYIEQLGYETVRNSISPPWQSSIRPLSQAAYEYILNEAGTQVIPKVEESVGELKEKLKAAVRAFYVEKDSAAIHLIESLAASIGQSTDISDKTNPVPYSVVKPPVQEKSPTSSETSAYAPVILAEKNPIAEVLHRILREETKDSHIGITVTYLQTKIIPEVGVLQHAVIKKVLLDAPWAKLRNGRWHYLEPISSETIPAAPTSINKKLETKESQIDIPTVQNSSVLISKKEVEAKFLAWLKADPSLVGSPNAYLAGIRSAELYARKHRHKNKLLFDTTIQTAHATIRELVASVPFASYSATCGDFPLKAAYKYIDFLYNAYIAQGEAPPNQQEAKTKKAETPISKKSVPDVQVVYSAKNLKGMFREYLTPKYSGDMVDALIASLEDADEFLRGFKIVTDTIFNISDFRLLSIAYESIYRDKSFRAKQQRKMRIVELALKEYVKFFKSLPQEAIDLATPNHKKSVKESSKPILPTSNQRELLIEYCRSMRIVYSYKPVLILALLQSGRKGSISVEKAAIYFRNFYDARRAAGRVAEKKSCIYLQEDITDEQIIINIINNPINSLCKSNFFFYNTQERIFSMEPEIWMTLSKSDKATISAICRQKLNTYYSD